MNGRIDWLDIPAYLICNDFSQGTKNLSTGGLGSKIWLIFGLYMYDAFMDIDLDG